MSKRRAKQSTTTYHPLAFGGWEDYDAWAANDFRPKPAEPAPEPPAPEPSPEPAAPDQPDDEPTVVLTAEELAEAPMPTARPYVRTRGRTRAAHELRLETIVSAAPGTPPLTDATGHRLRSLCVSPLSVAEIAAHLDLPLGVVRVLISDAITNRLVVVHDNSHAHTDRPSFELLERVHAGLMRL